MTIQLQFLPYELSKKMAELKFDEACLAKYNDNGEFDLLRKPSINIETFPICAPLWQQAFDWLSEKYNLDILIHKYKLDTYFISINNNFIVDELDFKLKFTGSEVKSAALEIAFKQITKN
jgi:hypothetical protein